MAQKLMCGFVDKIGSSLGCSQSAKHRQNARKRFKDVYTFGGLNLSRLSHQSRPSGGCEFGLVGGRRAGDLVELLTVTPKDFAANGLLAIRQTTLDTGVHFLAIQ